MSDVTISALHSALRGLAERQRVISDNLANVQTPRFLAGKVDFESSLRDAIATASDAEVSPSLARSLEPTREDGNNVNLDEETLSNVDTGLRYTLMVRAIDTKFSDLRTAMRG